jgi:hypothetical protein
MIINDDKHVARVGEFKNHLEVNQNIYLRFEVLTAVKMSILVFWVVTPVVEL